VKDTIPIPREILQEAIDALRGSGDPNQRNHAAKKLQKLLTTPAVEPCIGKDRLCPCQDGDACHYKDCGDTKAWPVPAVEPAKPNDWAAMIHYPLCWDTAAYPTLESAIDEVFAERDAWQHEFKAAYARGESDKDAIKGERDAAIAERNALKEALRDMLSGWIYIRQTHGDLYGVGWDRAQDKAIAAMQGSS
jgi:hypothetical protein